MSTALALFIIWALGGYIACAMQFGSLIEHERQVLEAHRESIVQYLQEDGQEDAQVIMLLDIPGMYRQWSGEAMFEFVMSWLAVMLCLLSCWKFRKLPKYRLIWPFEMAKYVSRG